MDPIKAFKEQLEGALAIADEKIRLAKGEMDLRANRMSELAQTIASEEARLNAAKRVLEQYVEDKKKIEDLLDSLSVHEFQTDVLFRTDEVRRESDLAKAKVEAHSEKAMQGVHRSQDPKKPKPAAPAAATPDEEEQPEDLIAAIEQQRGMSTEGEEGVAAKAAPDCTCMVTGPGFEDTTIDLNCPYHGEGGSMVATVPITASQTKREALRPGEMMDLVREAAAKLRAFTLPQIAADLGFKQGDKAGYDRVRSAANTLVKNGEFVNTGEKAPSEVGGAPTVVYTHQWVLDEENAKRRAKKQPAKARPKGEVLHLQTKGARPKEVEQERLNEGTCPKIGQHDLDEMIKLAWKKPGWRVVSRRNKVFIQPPGQRAQILVTHPRGNVEQVLKKKRSEFRKAGLEV